MYREDPLALERVVLNLGGNAIKFTPDGGRVDLTLTSTPAVCVLEVADTGMGISEEDQPRVRGRFYRSSEAYRRAVPGTGLGLSVVDAIVAAHGGTFDITSAPGRGTTVTVTLPLCGENRRPNELFHCGLPSTKGAPPDPVLIQIAAALG